MQRWMLIVLLVLGAHFAASYVIPGSGALLVAAIGFLGWTKVLPVALAVGLLWIVFARVSVAGLPAR